MNNKILDVLIKNKPNPIMLIETKHSDVDQIIFNYIKSINCSESNTFCNQCNNCKRVENKTYYDLKIIDGFFDQIQKEEIVSIINSFKMSSLEQAGNKFLVIYGIENANKFVVNSLLKSIEEPNTNTYYIFVSRNEQNVISTINSRCQIYKVLPDTQLLKNKLINENINDNQNIDDLINIFFNYKEIVKYTKDNTFEKINNIRNDLIKSQHNFPMLKKILNDFKKLSYYEIELLINLVSYNKSEIIKEQIMKLLSLCKFNINKTLIFNELTNIIF